VAVTTVPKNLATGSLKDLINSQYKSERVKLPLLHGGALRASEFGDVCPREEVLSAVLQVVRKETLGADSLMVFLHGSALHWALQNHVLPIVGALIGRWSCLGCGVVYGVGKSIPASLVPRPPSCTACGGSQFHYLEVQLYNAEFDIGGHPDGFLIIPGLPGVGIIEGKSIAQGWSVKQCPMFTHVIQVQIYMWFTGLLWAKILYWEKGVNGLDALIEHHVERDEDTIVAIKDAIKSIWGALAGEAPLPDRICASPEAPRAEKCCVGEPCFASPSVLLTTNLPTKALALLLAAPTP
jgi:hypothetical protein